jgi:hypothetical protein
MSAFAANVAERTRFRDQERTRVAGDDELRELLWEHRQRAKLTQRELAALDQKVISKLECGSKQWVLGFDPAASLRRVTKAAKR